MTDDDLMDFLMEGPWSARVVARQFGYTEHRARQRLQRLVDKGLVEGDRTKPVSIGMMGAPQIKYRLKRTGRAA